MDQELDKKIELKDKIILFLKDNKRKLIIFLLIVFTIIFSVIFIKINEEKKNILMSEKYIQAGIYLTSNNKEKSKELFEEIILSKNSFYSILSLNVILEKELETDQNKILSYFDLIEKNIISKSQNELLTLKKALYLIKISKTFEGERLLKQLLENNSKYKAIAEEIINK